MAQSFEGPGLYGSSPPACVLPVAPCRCSLSVFSSVPLFVLCPFPTLFSLHLYFLGDFCFSVSLAVCVLEFVFVGVGACVSGYALQEVFLIS